jgi:hypothetical protein
MAIKPPNDALGHANPSSRRTVVISRANRHTTAAFFVVGAVLFFQVGNLMEDDREGAGGD